MFDWLSADVISGVRERASLIMHMYHRLESCGVKNLAAPAHHTPECTVLFAAIAARAIAPRRCRMGALSCLTGGSELAVARDLAVTAD